jgi:predicted enzyme related to lactoylglutathione lyase
MTAHAHYRPGVPCWIETAQPDPEAARAFYSRLMRWTATDLVPKGSPGHYFLAALDGLAVAGIASGDGDRARWNTYVAVDDADAVTRLVDDHGGSVRDEPFDGGDRGRGAVCVDPAGAAFGIWQAGDASGVEVRRVPGAWEVSDLHTDQPIETQTFYESVFGWRMGSVEVGAGESASAFRVDEETVGWLVDLAPEDDGPCWHVTFSVANRDEASATAQRLGAEILSELDSRWSRAAVVRDPQGAMFSLSQALRGN